MLIYAIYSMYRTRLVIIQKLTITKLFNYILDKEERFHTFYLSNIFTF